MSATGLNYVPQYIAHGFSWDALLPYYSLQGVAGRGRLHPVRRDRRRRHGHRVPFAGAGRVLVLDEPTDGLDERNTDVVADVLRSFAGAGKTVLFSTTTTSLSGSSPASSTYTPPTKRGTRWHSLCATALRACS